MRRLALSVLSLVPLGGPTAAEELGPAFAGYEVEALAGFMTPSGQLFEIGTITGTLDFEDDDSVLEHAALHCAGTFEANAQGRCAIITAAEGVAEGQDQAAGGDDAAAGEEAEDQGVAGEGLNHLWTTYSCSPAAEDVPADVPDAQSCTLSVIEGNGAFEGASGTATLIAVPPIVGHPDGSASAYALIQSFDLVLAQ